MPLAGRDRAIAEIHAVTPYRTTEVVWDTADNVLNEPPFCRHVEREQFRAQSTSNTIRLLSGAWILKPLNYDFGFTHETTAGQQYVIRKSEFYASGQVVEVPFQRIFSELSGVSPGGGVSTTGDYWMTRRIAAGASWNGSLLTAQNALPDPGPNYPMDLLLEGPTIGKEDPWQGYIVKFLVPGSDADNPQRICTFYFGGPLVEGVGYGQFAVDFNGNGLCAIAEFVSGEWIQRRSFRYARPSEVCNRLHAILIIPHPPAYIDFSVYSPSPRPAQYPLISESFFRAARDADADSVQSTIIETFDRGRYTYSGPSGTLLSATGYGFLMFEVRRDLRLYWQFQRVVYPASGTITEYGFTVPYRLGSAHPLVLRLFAWDLADASLAPQTQTSFYLQNPDTAAPLPLQNETYTLGGQSVTDEGFQLPGDENKCQLVVTLENIQTGARHYTPAFYGYEARRNGNIASLALGEKQGGAVREVAISGPDSDPDHETATIRISDLGNDLAFLRQRGRVPCRIQTQYDALDPTKKSILFEGYGGRIEARRRHALGVDYPDPLWHDDDCEMLGKWERLKETYFTNFVSFLDERTCPYVRPETFTGPNRKTKVEAWKVTDAIRWVLFWLGFSDSQLDIPNDDIRFFGNPAANNLTLSNPDPSVKYADWLKQVAMMFLNAFLIWDANAGSLGMWRLIRAVQPDATPRWGFTTALQPPFHLAAKSGAYGAGISPILGPWPYTRTVIPPEANTLYVLGAINPLPNGEPGLRLSSSYVNRSAFNAPGYSIATPDSLDWLPYVKEIRHVDGTIDSVEALCFVGRRIFNLACRGRQYARWTAELVLISDTDPVYTIHQRRPLRMGDPVTIDGDLFMIRSVNPYWHKDWIQLATYEAEQIRQDLVYW